MNITNKDQKMLVLKTLQVFCTQKIFSHINAVLNKDNVR